MPARTLVIEDNAENLDLMTYLLEAFGHTTWRAHDGKEGLEAVARDLPDLIVCDIQMPKMDGFQAAREIKKDRRLSQIPLIAITAYAMVGDRERILAAGFDGYIPKPINPETFVKQVESFLASSHFARQAVLPARESMPDSDQAPTVRTNRASTGSGSSAATSGSQLHNGTILIVDDSSTNIELAKSSLEPFGYHVVAALGSGGPRTGYGIPARPHRIRPPHAGYGRLRPFAGGQSRPAVRRHSVHHGFFQRRSIR
jgi:CheY-like chemotaxis protein